MGAIINCDVNNDGLIDIFDLTFVAAHLDTSDPIADLNSNGLVDIFDISLVAYAYGDDYRLRKTFLPIIFR